MGTLVVGSYYAAVSLAVVINQISYWDRVTNGTSMVAFPMNKADVRETVWTVVAILLTYGCREVELVVNVKTDMAIGFNQAFVLITRR